MAKKAIKNKTKLTTKVFDFSKKPEKSAVIYNDYNEFVLFGEDNKLPKQYLNFYNNVSLHRSIINSKVNTFVGDGITFEYSDDLISRRTEKFLQSINNFTNESFDELFKKIGVDWFNNGGSYIGIIQDSKNLQIFHLQYDKMRAGKPNKYGLTEEFYYNPSDIESEEWGKYTDLNDVITYPVYDFESSKKVKVMYLKKYNPDNLTYSFPDWNGVQTDLSSMGSVKKTQDS